MSFTRETVFAQVLSIFDKRKISILELGSIRDFNSKEGDGWSTYYFAKHIKEHGGFLKTTNTKEDELLICKQIIDAEIGLSNINMEFVNKDGIYHIDNTYDLIYLDGSDCPLETKIQFELCDLDKTFVLIDDHHTKGSLIFSDYLLKIFSFESGHEMALYGKLNGAKRY